jgi:hypothetical protein
MPKGETNGITRYVVSFVPILAPHAPLDEVV